jgi:hypothetical protein
VSHSREQIAPPAPPLQLPIPWTWGPGGKPRRMGLAWGWHGVGMGLAWGSHGVRMGFAWGSHGVRMGFAWGSHGVRMGFAWGLPIEAC